jgi:hypothetical protein
MKCEKTNAVLTFVLGVLILLDVLFALRTINYTRELRSLQFQAAQDQLALTQIQQIESMARDVSDYNQKVKSPELARILAAAQNQQPTTKKP